MSTDTTLPRGLRIAEAWLEQIKTATGREPDVATVERVTTQCHQPGRCGSCAVDSGRPHEHGCSVERCQRTGLQRIACGQVHEHGSETWDGVWPGTAECVEYGWFVDSARHPCGPQHPEAAPHTDRLQFECDWDRGLHRWVRRFGQRLGAEG